MEIHAGAGYHKEQGLITYLTEALPLVLKTGRLG